MAFNKVTADNHLPGEGDARFPVYSKQLNEIVTKLNVVTADTQGTAIADLGQDISATYVEAEIQAISDKVDVILAALRTAKIIAA